MRQHGLSASYITVSMLATFTLGARAHLCGYITGASMPVTTSGATSVVLQPGTLVTFSDRLTQGLSLGDTNCYVTLFTPGVGSIKIHSGKCHHASLYDYPADKVHAQAPAAAPSAAPAASPTPASAGNSPARRLLQEGDGLVEDDTWFINVTGQC